jgi:hypothetical protein
MDAPDSHAASAGRRQDELHAAWRAERQASWEPAKSLGPLPQTAGTVLPPAVAWLGYGGLVPFVALAAGTTLGGPHADLWRAALFSYGAVILSFVGALHWGIALAAPGLGMRQRSALFAWSVVPALLAWPALLLYVKPATVLLLGGFAAHYWQDLRLVRSADGGGALPGWYLPLRLRLTLVACACLAAGGLWDPA